MNSNISFILRVIQKEVWARRRLVIFLYILTSLIFLVIAWSWPRVYTSSSTVFADTQNILQPLMEGTAVTTGVTVKTAEQIIYSRKTTEKVLRSEFWFADDEEKLNDAKFVDLKMYQIENNASVENAGENLIKISYKDVNPEKAHETTKLLTSIFIDDSLMVKREESRSAYEFINNQVKLYHQKLQAAEEAIKEFRSSNIDASPDAKSNANSRLIEIKRELETLDIDISSQETVLFSLRKQLAGESGSYNKVSLDRENQLNEKVLSFEDRLEELKLNYHDSYPDIVQLKSQINSLRQQITEEREKRLEMAKQGKRQAPTGTIARNLRSEILKIETEITSLNNKRNQLLSFVERERETLESINAVEAKEAELTRDYSINQNTYQNLLGQRESARISMNIDINNQGLTLKIQEEASFPTSPKGPQFLHIILAGLALSLVIPVGLVYGLTLVDQKIRSDLVIRENCRLPIWASVHETQASKEKKGNYLKASVMVLTILSVWVVYAYAIHLKTQSYAL